MFRVHYSVPEGATRDEIERSLLNMGEAVEQLELKIKEEFLPPIPPPARVQGAWEYQRGEWVEVQ